MSQSCDEFAGHRYEMDLDRTDYAKCKVCGKQTHCSEFDHDTWARLNGTTATTVFVPTESDIKAYFLRPGQAKLAGVLD